MGLRETSHVMGRKTFNTNTTIPCYPTTIARQLNATPKIKRTLRNHESTWDPILLSVVRFVVLLLLLLSRIVTRHDVVVLLLPANILILSTTYNIPSKISS
jgi:hypothetical protein